jgi:hypothetical protein
MWKFYFEVVQFYQLYTDTMKILEKVLFWCQKWIYKRFGGFWIETVNVKVVDNN